MPVIFPDIEKTLVSFLNTELAAIDDQIANNVRIATKKAEPGINQPDKEVVLVGAYNQTIQKPLRAATVTVDVYATDYGTASELSLLIAALIVECIGDPIKRAIVSLGPVRMTDESPLEKRSMTVELTVKGSEL